MARHMSWKQLSSKEVYRNPWLSVTEDQVETETGKHFLFGIVHKPPSVHVIPWDGTRFTLVGQYRYPIDTFTWEFPAGRAEGVSLEEMARQELREETGLQAEKLEFLGVISLASSHHDQKSHVFFATELTRGETSREPSEEGMQIREVTPEELRAMIVDGTFSESSSVAAFGLLCAKGLFPFV